MLDDSYFRNAELLEQVVKNGTALFPISRHRKEDGSLDVEGNLKVWRSAAEPFYKTVLWEDGAPGFDQERTPLQDNPYFIFVPSGCGEKRGTILVAHGGGFSWRTGSEGFHVAHYFHRKGFNVAILCYRLLPYSRFECIADMNRAIRILKSKRGEWNLGEKICAMGFSAGAMLSGNCATHPEPGCRESTDPVERENTNLDAAVIGYGAMSFVSFPQPFGQGAPDSPLNGIGIRQRFYLALEKNVTPETPPMFIWQTMSDDGRHGMCLAKALQDAGVPYELHIFTPGVHGMAMADGGNDLAMDIPHVTHWGELCAEWLTDLGF